MTRITLVSLPLIKAQMFIRGRAMADSSFCSYHSSRLSCTDLMLSKHRLQAEKLKARRKDDRQHVLCMPGSSGKGLGPLVQVFRPAEGQ